MFEYSTGLPPLLFVAVCEELFFRGLLFPEFMERLQLKPLEAAFLTSGIFAGLHVLNINSYATIGYVCVQVLFSFSIGLFLAYLYLKKGIIACIALHAIINIISLYTESCNAAGKVVLSNIEIIIYLFLAIVFILFSIKSLKIRK